MRVYRCDLCGGIFGRTSIVRVQHWFNNSDVCCECWNEFKTLRRIEKAKEKEKNDLHRR